MRVNLEVKDCNDRLMPRLGARWDASLGRWYVVDVENLARFAHWIPKSLMAPNTERHGGKTVQGVWPQGAWASKTLPGEKPTKKKRGHRNKKANCPGNAHRPTKRPVAKPKIYGVTVGEGYAPTNDGKLPW